MADSQTPAGWYRDPQMQNTQRYWDGTAWTQNFSPVAPQTSDNGSRMTGQSLPTPVIMGLIAGFMIFFFIVFVLIN